jgi:hypothetical protein
MFFLPRAILENGPAPECNTSAVKLALAFQPEHLPARRGD